MSTTEIIPGVLWQSSLRIVNVFVLNDGHELTVIDTGTPGSEGTIAKGIEGIGRKPTSAGARRVESRRRSELADGSQLGGLQAVHARATAPDSGVALAVASRLVRG